MPFTPALRTLVETFGTPAQTIAEHEDILLLTSETDLIGFCNALPYFLTLYPDDKLLEIVQAMPEQRRALLIPLVPIMLKSTRVSPIIPAIPNQLNHKALRLLTNAVKQLMNLLIVQINSPDELAALYDQCLTLLSVNLNGVNHFHVSNNIGDINYIRDNAHSLCTSLAVQMITTPEGAEHLQLLLSRVFETPNLHPLTIHALLRSVFVLGSVNLDWSLKRFEASLPLLPVESTVFYAHHNTIAQGYLGLLNYLNIDKQFFQCQTIISAISAVQQSAIYAELMGQSNENILSVYMRALAHMTPHLSHQHKADIRSIITHTIANESTSEHIRNHFTQLLEQMDIPFLHDITPLIMMPLQVQAPEQNATALDVESNDAELLDDEPLNWHELLHGQLLDNDIIDQTENANQLIAFLCSTAATEEDIIEIWEIITEYLDTKEESHPHQEETLVRILQSIMPRFQLLFSSHQIASSSKFLISTAHNGREYIAPAVFNLLYRIVPTGDVSCNRIIWHHLLEEFEHLKSLEEGEFADDDDDFAEPAEKCATNIERLIWLFGLLFPHVSHAEKKSFWQSLNELLSQEHIAENYSFVVYETITNSLAAIAPQIATGDLGESRQQVALYKNALLLTLAHFEPIAPPNEPIPLSGYTTNSLSIIAQNEYHQLYPLTIQAFVAMAPFIQDAGNIAIFQDQLRPLFAQERFMTQMPSLVLTAMAWAKSITPSVIMMDRLLDHINNPVRYNEPHQRYALAVQLFALASFSMTSTVANSLAYNSASNGLYHLITHTNPIMQASGLEVLNKLTEHLVKRWQIEKIIANRHFPEELARNISPYLINDTLPQYDENEIERRKMMCISFYLQLSRRLKETPIAAPENQVHIHAAIRLIDTCWKLPVPIATKSCFFGNNKRSLEDGKVPLSKVLRK